jgi:hypothetical protein
MLRRTVALLAGAALVALAPGCEDSDAPSGEAVQRAAAPGPAEPDTERMTSPDDNEPARTVVRAVGGAGIGTDAQRSAPLCERGTLVAFQVAGDKAVEAWHVARKLVAETGHWPVILGDDEALAGVIDNVRVNCEDGGSPRAAVDKARSIDVRGALEARAEELEIGAAELEADTPLEDRDAPAEYYTAPTDIVTSEYLDKAWIGLVPTRRSWEVPAVMLWGGWNDAPDPAMQVAMHRYWGERYGSEIVSLLPDVIETRVARPPTTDSEAAALAREQFIYAPDIVWQGTDDVTELATGLRRNPSWYFWWD